MDDLISRQAAIDHWRLIIDATNTDSRYNMGFIDGLEFCISHLSTMPSAQPEINCSEFPNNSDTISRQAAIDALNEVTIVHSITDFDAISAILDLPPIQPKRGKWIDKGVYTYVDDHRHLYKCDQCGNGWPDTPDFCPNCGAKMEVTNGN